MRTMIPGAGQDDATAATRLAGVARVQLPLEMRVRQAQAPWTHRRSESWSLRTKVGSKGASTEQTSPYSLESNVLRSRGGSGLHG